MSSGHIHFVYFAHMVDHLVSSSKAVVASPVAVSIFAIDKLEIGSAMNDTDMSF